MSEGYRRNKHRVNCRLRREVFDSLGRAEHAAAPLEPLAATATPVPVAREAAGGGGGLLMAQGTSVREAWVAWLAPVFAGTQSCYFTGTYSDDYGYSNGLMLSRNVHKDFKRFLESFDFEGRYVVGVEPHAWRDVLHLHAILEGPFTDEQMRWVKGWWSVDRGHARALPVLDGCESYVTKYALKNDTDNFEWRLS